MNLSYQEKRTLVSIITGMMIVISYCLYVVVRYRSGTLSFDDMKSWAVVMLVFIGIGIAAGIVIQILFHILFSITVAVKEGGADEKKIERTVALEMVEDERDRLIELKAMRAGYAVAAAGIVAGIVTIAAGFSAAVMLNIVFLSAAAGATLEGVVQLYFYRKGIRHG